MLSPLVETVRQRNPVDWLAIVTRALESVCVSGISPAASNTLATLNSYSAAPLSLYTDITTGLKDVQVHVALLRALDATVASWPASVRRQICAPPLPAAQGSQSLPLSCARTGSQPCTPTQERASSLTVPVEGIRPLSEAVVLLHRAAAANVEAGLCTLERVTAGAARLTGSKSRLSTGSGQSKPTGTASLHAPSTHAKTAYKHFIIAQQLATSAVTLLMESAGYGVALSPVESQYLRSIVDFGGLRTLTDLAVATCKYIYALFTSATATAPSTLAGLAFAASSLPVPVTIHAPSLHLLPTLLLAAYHQHRAEQYYQVDAKEPDMANALAHIDVADAILREVQRQAVEEGSVGSTTPPPSASAPSSTTAGPTTLSGRLRRVLQTLTASPLKGHAFKAKQAREDAESDDADEQHVPAACEGFYAELAEYARDSELLRWFPVLDHMLRSVHELRGKYRRENRLVYFVKAAPIATAQADVPKITEASREDAAAATAAGLQAILPNPTYVLDCSVFETLPSAATLAAKAATARRKGALLEAVERLSAVVSAVQAFGLSDEARLALEALEPCLEPHTGSVSHALHVATEMVQQAWARHASAAEHWSVAQAKLLRRTDGVPPSDLTLSLEREMTCWTEEVAEATQLWLRAIGPLDVASTCRMEQLRDGLAPQAVEAQRYADRCAKLADEAAKVEENGYHWSDDDGDDLGRGGLSTRKRLRWEAPSAQTPLTDMLEQLQSLTREGDRLLAWLKSSQAEPAMAERLTAMKAVALCVWDAPRVTNRLDEGTARLADETVEATVTAQARAKVAEVKAAAGQRVKSGKESRAKATPDSSEGFRTPLEGSDTDNEEEGKSGVTVVANAEGGKKATTFSKEHSRKKAATKRSGLRIKVIQRKRRRRKKH